MINQGQHPPFDPNKAVERFVRVLRDYRVVRVVGDRYAGETFRAQFTSQGIAYEVSKHSTSELYEALEPRLNEPGRIVLLDVADARAAVARIDLARRQNHAPERRA